MLRAGPQESHKTMLAQACNPRCSLLREWGIFVQLSASPICFRVCLKNLASCIAEPILKIYNWVVKFCACKPATWFLNSQSGRNDPIVNPAERFDALGGCVASLPKSKASVDHGDPLPLARVSLHTRSFRAGPCPQGPPDTPRAGRSPACRGTPVHGDAA